MITAAFACAAISAEVVSAHDHSDLLPGMLFAGRSLLIVFGRLLVA